MVLDSLIDLADSINGAGSHDTSHQAIAQVHIMENELLEIALRSVRKGGLGSFSVHDQSLK
jgi:hypothetical protein